MTTGKRTHFTVLDGVFVIEFVGELGKMETWLVEIADDTFKEVEKEEEEVEGSE